jgi:hypothetical protein
VPGALRTVGVWGGETGAQNGGRGNSLAVWLGWWSSTPMTHHKQPQPLAGSPPPTGGGLDEAFVEALARRVVVLIRNESNPPVARRMVDAATLACELGVERSWVYAHRQELGGVQLGTGSKPRLRFDAETARELLVRSTGDESQAPQTPVPAGSSARRRRQRLGSSPKLLPIRGVGVATEINQERLR